MSRPRQWPFSASRARARQIRDLRLPGSDVYDIFDVSATRSRAMRFTIGHGAITQMLAIRLRGRGPNADYLAAVATGGRGQTQAPPPNRAFLAAVCRCAALLLHPYEQAASDNDAAAALIRGSTRLRTLILLITVLRANCDKALLRELQLPEMQAPWFNWAGCQLYIWIQGALDPFG